MNQAFGGTIYAGVNELGNSGLGHGFVGFSFDGISQEIHGEPSGGAFRGGIRAAITDSISINIEKRVVDADTPSPYARVTIAKNVPNEIVDRILDQVFSETRQQFAGVEYQIPVLDAPPSIAQNSNTVAQWAIARTIELLRQAGVPVVSAIDLTAIAGDLNVPGAKNNAAALVQVSAPSTGVLAEFFSKVSDFLELPTLEERLQKHGFDAVVVNDNGQIGAFLDNEDKVIGVQGYGMSPGQLAHYSTLGVNENGIPERQISLGGIFRSIGDWLGLDRKFGLDGSFSRPGEGTNRTSASKDSGGSGEWKPTMETSPRPKPRPPGLGDDDDNEGFDNSGGRVAEPPRDHGDNRPILLDLDGNGIEITQLSQSTRFVADDSGLSNRTAWAGAGDGVLFIDADGNGALSNQHEYVFTEWAAGSTDDLDGLRRAFDSNGDGKLTSADTRFGEFRVLVTNADGSTTVRTLASLGITEIKLTADTTNIRLPDGSMITGQATFVANGVTRTVANATLMAEAQGYRVVEAVSTDASGNRVVVQTGYDAKGDAAFVIRSVTSPDGLTITNSFDNDGDGVVDRLQTIVTVVNGNGSRTETVTNLGGAVLATAVKLNSTQTTTSADGAQVTILRDRTGGGWNDQSEVRTTAVDGSRTVAISDLAQNGSVIRSSSESISANGLTRVTSLNQDGLAGADTITTETVSTNGTGVRTETTSITNGDASLRTVEVLTISADGRTRTTTRDLDGDGDTDVQLGEVTTLPGTGGTSTVISTRNGDASLRSQTTATISADGLTLNEQVDIDGDGEIDRSTSDTTVVDGSGVRTQSVTVTNTDGSVFSKVQTILGADKVSSETRVDQNQDGVFQATDLVRSVTVNATTQARTETTWARNPDGSIRAVSVAVTGADGLTTSTTVDADGDGDTDRAVSDVTTVMGGASTRVVEVKNQDSSLRTRDVTTTSADGLTVTRTTDTDGDGTIDARTSDVRIVGGDLNVTRTISDFAGNGTTLTGRTVSVESADRRTMTVTVDANGDGATDRVMASVEAADGSKTVMDTQYYASGAVAAKSVTVTSANGLISSTTVDANGDSVNETVVWAYNNYEVDGARRNPVLVYNGDGSLRSQSVSYVSDDGLVTSDWKDSDGDNFFERTAYSVTTLNSNGSVDRLEVSEVQNGPVLARSLTTTSDDGLVVVFQSDADGDGDFDLVTTRTVTLLNDGGQTVTSELRTETGVLRTKTATTSTDDGRSVTTSADTNGDGQTDSIFTRVVGNDGQVTSTVSQQSATGGLLSRCP